VPNVPGNQPMPEYEGMALGQTDLARQEGRK
jgi:hypothetical protein